MYNLNNPILLLFRHLVIARQAEPTTENIGSYIDSRALYVSICATSTIALNRYERIRPVNRLHMHGLSSGSDGITTICSILDGVKKSFSTIY
jgi:hypothetical protein